MLKQLLQFVYMLAQSELVAISAKSNKSPSILFPFTPESGFLYYLCLDFQHTYNQLLNESQHNNHTVSLLLLPDATGQ